MSAQHSLSFRAWLRLVRVTQKHDQLFASRLRPLDLSCAQHDVLANLLAEEGVSQSELADRLLLTKGTITGLLQRLEARGLIRRETDPDDARTNRIYLTVKGKEKATEAVAVQEDIVDELMQPVSHEEQETLRRLMKRIEGQLDEMA